MLQLDGESCIVKSWPLAYRRGLLLRSLPPPVLSHRLRLAPTPSRSLSLSLGPSLGWLRSFLSLSLGWRARLSRTRSAASLPGAVEAAVDDVNATLVRPEAEDWADWRAVESECCSSAGDKFRGSASTSERARREGWARLTDLSSGGVGGQAERGPHRAVPVGAALACVAEVDELDQFGVDAGVAERL